jgi:hypothetical protein
LKPKPNHFRLNSKVWFRILAKLNSEFSLGLTKSALNQTKLNFGSTTVEGRVPALMEVPGLGLGVSGVVAMLLCERDDIVEIEGVGVGECTRRGWDWATGVAGDARCECRSG